jgi:hypothetical protein
MASSPTQKKTPNPGQLKPFEFQEFVHHFPHAALKKAGIKRYAFVCVSMELTRYGNFETGTQLRPSIGELADASGVSEPTVRRVLAYLRAIEALVCTGEHRHGGGSPIQEHRFNRSIVVRDVLAIRDRDHGRVKQGTTQAAQGESREPLRVKQETPEGKAGDHDRKSQKIKGNSLADAPSPAPSSLLPSASDGAAEETQRLSEWDSEALLAEVGTLSVEELLAGI